MFSSRAGFKGRDENSGVFTKALIDMMRRACRHAGGHDTRVAHWVLAESTGCQLAIRSRFFTYRPINKIVRRSNIKNIDHSLEAGGRQSR